MASSEWRMEESYSLFATPCLPASKPRPSAKGIKPLLTPRSWSWLHSSLHTRVDRIHRCRAADVKSISLLTAEAQVGDRFRNVDLAEQIALWSVAAHAVLVRIAPTY